MKNSVNKVQLMEAARHLPSASFNVIEDAQRIKESDEFFNTKKFKDGKTLRQEWEDWRHGRGT